MGTRVKYQGVEYDVVRAQGEDLALRHSDGSLFGVKAAECERIAAEPQPVPEDEGDAISADEPAPDDFDLDEDEEIDDED
jgi:hypothetical protein